MKTKLNKTKKKPRMVTSRHGKNATTFLWECILKNFPLPSECWKGVREIKCFSKSFSLAVMIDEDLSVALWSQEQKSPCKHPVLTKGDCSHGWHLPFSRIWRNNACFPWFATTMLKVIVTLTIGFHEFCSRNNRFYC